VAPGRGYAEYTVQALTAICTVSESGACISWKCSFQECEIHKLPKMAYFHEDRKGRSVDVLGSAFAPKPTLARLSSGIREAPAIAELPLADDNA
jgi:hypothetical protein